MYILGYSGFTRNARLGLGVRSAFAKTDQGFDSIFDFREGEVPFSMFPLGYFGHDASAALLKDGKVLACAAEERFTRVKYSLNLAGNTLLPRHAVEYCLKAAGIKMDDVDIVAHYCDFAPPMVERRLELLRPFLTLVQAVIVEDAYRQVYADMMARDVVLGQFVEMTGAQPRCFMPVRHHKAHAASAFYPSGFGESLILTIDGTGEVESAFLAVGSDCGITEIATTYLPTSLGALYLIITVFLGFKSLGDEYKVMGLAAYGDPAKYRKVFSQLIDRDGNGTYSTSMLAKPELKDFVLRHLGMPRGKSDPFEARHADIAASLQESLNETVLYSLRHARAETKYRNLCMAGGVALNCSMNGVIARSRLFENIFVQPAAGDEGCSAGAALAAFAELKNRELPEDLSWDHVYWGPAFTDTEIAGVLGRFSDKVSWKECENITAEAARQLVGGSVVGWFQGRMEFGPRALGNRSILADPRDGRMKDVINEKVKRREAFRPFAPAVLEEEATEYFDMTGLRSSPFMLFTVSVKPERRAIIPAVTHIDGTARVQTVSRKTNPRFWDLIAEFKNLTGVPVLLNTSFNVKNEPIVCSPYDAVQCFLSTNIDCLAIGDYLVEKK
jgi:carbamoyltransferase